MAAIRCGRWLLTMIVVACAAIFLSGLAVADTFTVKATSSATWKPSSKDIAKGDRIRWSNPTSITHNVKSRGSNWSYFQTLQSGERVSRAFKRRGTYKYRCTIHSSVSNGKCSGMCGRITV
jgi:plastocyanin